MDGGRCIEHPPCDGVEGQMGAVWMAETLRKPKDALSHTEI
jgi:hypothetical protein